MFILNRPPDQRVVEKLSVQIESYIKEKLGNCEVVPEISDIISELFDPMLLD